MPHSYDKGLSHFDFLEHRNDCDRNRVFYLRMEMTYNLGHSLLTPVS